MKNVPRVVKAAVADMAAVAADTAAAEAVAVVAVAVEAAVAVTVIATKLNLLYLKPVHCAGFFMSPERHSRQYKFL